VATPPDERFECLRLNWRNSLNRLMDHPELLVFESGPQSHFDAQACLDKFRHQSVDKVRSPNAKAPSFADFASMPGMMGTALMVALTTPHADMPMFNYTGERDHIEAYVRSLHSGLTQRNANLTSACRAAR
jgi:hypothetical protein